MEKMDAIVALSALAQSSRMDMFRLLVAAGAEGLPAGRIGEQLDLPAPTCSFHLNQLRQAGLVTARRESRSIIYVADILLVRSLLVFLTQDCCGGHPEICLPLLAPDSAGETACCPAKEPV